MAATLPAIHNPGSRSPSIQQHNIPSVGSKGQSDRHVVMVPTKRRNRGNKEQEMEERKFILRAQQPALSKPQTTQYRNTYKHNLCLDMLQEGFHRSFAELFALIKTQNEERDAAGPESLLWNQNLLENEPEKLETLKMNLTQAEIALRKGNLDTVYSCQYKLARYFQGTGDKWLSDHFFEECLRTTRNIQGDEGRLAAQGHCNVGLAQEQSGDYFDAADNFEMFLKLAYGKSDWQLEDGSEMHMEACRHLSRIYTTIAKQFDSAGDLQQYLDYLEKAFNMAKEGGNKQIMGEASFRLGQAFEKNKDSQTALQYLNGYLDTCQELGDNDGYGRACEAIAKSYESQGKVKESIKYLEMFVEVAEKSKNDQAISKACSDLGAVFNSLGRYQEAVEYFNKSYNISRSMNDAEAISSSRVLFGVAAAHKMLMGVTTHVDQATKTCLERLIDWKDNRGDDFEKPNEEPEAEESPAVPSSAGSSQAEEAKPDTTAKDGTAADIQEGSEDQNTNQEQGS